MKITSYAFPTDPALSEYCVFPKVLEDDELVLFHATPAENFDAILCDGFKIPDSEGVFGLQSVSFGKRSVIALTHAMNRRKNKPGVYCIIAVRYETLDREGLTLNLSDIHDYKLRPAPKIIGYIDVPETYKHL
jgi:hypothetical protein